jgi:predicted DCC family thiol-disulfide oxidoreductase YuxK
MDGSHQTDPTAGPARAPDRGPTGSNPGPSTWQIDLLFDGGCPLCAREIAMLRRLDRGRDRIRFTDIAARDFEASRFGTTRAALMARIHGILPDGTLVEGVEVFRRAYAAVGLGFLLAPTRWPGLRAVSDCAYRWFARNRYRLTGRTHMCYDNRCLHRLETSSESGP